MLWGAAPSALFFSWRYQTNSISYQVSTEKKLFVVIMEKDGGRDYNHNKYKLRIKSYKICIIKKTFL